MLANITTECEASVFLLLTDGYTESDEINSTSFYQQYISTKLTAIGKSPDNIKLISFVYGVENNINYGLVKELTCVFQGIVFRMWDGIDYFTMI